MATLITVALDSLGSSNIVASSGRVSAVAITLLVIGAPLCWRYWSNIRRFRAADPEAEVGSVTWRTYLFLLFGAAGLVAVVNLLVLVFLIVEDLLEGPLGAATVSLIAVPAALLITSGVVAGYHFTVFREDRLVITTEQAPAVREIIVVGGADTAAAIASGTTAEVRPLRVIDHRTEAATLDDVLVALGAETHERVVVVDEEDHFEVLPIAT